MRTMEELTRSLTSLTSTRQLIKFSNYSVCLTLPKAMLEQLHLAAGDQVQLRLVPNQREIVIAVGRTVKIDHQDETTQEVPLPMTTPTTTLPNRDGLLPIPEIEDE